MNPINVYQKEFAVTTADSEKPQIQTGSFGPCCVVTWASPGRAALAHIDDNTDVNSVECVVNTFKESSVDLKDIKATVMGGWFDFDSSREWAHAVLDKIATLGVDDIDETKMFLKYQPSYHQLLMTGVPLNDLPKHYYMGATVDAISGKTVAFEDVKQLDFELSKENRARLGKFRDLYGADTEVELPLTRVE